MEKNIVEIVTLVLVIIGGINWGLIGLTDLLGIGTINLVQIIFGWIPYLVSIIYILVGVSSLYLIYYATKRDY